MILAGTVGTVGTEWVRDLKLGDTIPDGPPGTAQFVPRESWFCTRRRISPRVGT